MAHSRGVRLDRETRPRATRVLFLGGASLLMTVLGSLLAPRWFHLVVILIVFGNVIGLLLLSPRAPDHVASKSQSRRRPRV